MDVNRETGGAVVMMDLWIAIANVTEVREKENARDTTIILEDLLYLDVDRLKDR